MKSEMKIVLPFYKLAYAFSFIVILSLARGTTYTFEVGIAIEASAAILVSVFCADTYVREIVSRRSEVHRLYPMKKRKASVLKRLLIQALFLIFLEIVGYELFFVFQKPITHSATESELKQFLIYILAMSIMTFFWGVLSNTLSMLFRNMWAGIGACLVIWLAANSVEGDKILGVWNLFSYSFRTLENSADFSWMCGKALCMFFTVIMLAALPILLRKRG